jgi:hypothetical protein
LYGFTDALFLHEARTVWGELEAVLSVIYSSESAPARTVARATAMLPLLVILFIVSYGILTMLVVEQGQTIESQRSLIREMLKDSNQLATLKGKIARDDSKRMHDQAPAQNHSDVDSGKPGTGMTGSDKNGKQAGKSHAMKEVPGKPAADLEDVRRATRVI